MIQGKSVLALVVARGGSKGLPGKNIKAVLGRPLIQWTTDAARQSRYVDRLVLSSDDPAIIAVAAQCGCEAPFRRPAELATDEASSVDVTLDALRRLPGYDIMVLLQPTSPLRTAADIDGALELLLSTGAPSCVAVRPAQDHPYWTYRVESNGRLAAFAEPTGGMPQRRQDLPPAWCVNGAVYAVWVDRFSLDRSFLTRETVAYPMPTERSIDIDTAEDLEHMIATASSMQLAGTVEVSQDVGHPT